MPETRLFSKTHTPEKKRERKMDLILNADLQGEMSVGRKFIHETN